MNYAELTPARSGGYDGYMSASPRSEQQPAAEVSPGPVTEAGKSLYENAQKGTESGEEPAVAQTDARAEYAKQAQKERKTAYTRDKLTEISQAVRITASAGEVRKYAELVAAAANVLEEAVKKKTGQNDASPELREKLEKADVFKRAERLLRDIDGAPIGDEEGRARGNNALQNAGQVSRLAEEVAGYFKAAELTLERDDPFKPITSFEELMGKFNKIQLDARFRPGGEFSLIDVSEYVDQFGRTLLKEKAHPENFLRWVRERAWFYHDFDPMANIDLFKGMYIVAGSRTVSMYEMVVDFDTYFAHRQETYGNLRVQSQELVKAQDNRSDKPQTFFPNGAKIQDLQPGESYGKYKLTDSDTGKETIYDVKLIYKDESGNAVFDVLDKNGNPVQALVQNKEEWNNAEREESTSKEFEEAKTEIMYEIWLLTRSHNMDVAYRQKAMPNENPLKETMAELYADNIWTRTRSRILKMFNMPTTTHRGDRVMKLDDKGKPVLNEDKTPVWEMDTRTETVDKMEGKLTNPDGTPRQGSSGKAFQRSLAAYYHISEANAAFNGYVLEGGRNPFFEVMKKGEVNGAEVFYKSLIRRTLEDSKFDTNGSYKYDKKNPGKSNVAGEFLGRLNDTYIPRDDGTSRQRHEWEKADLFDFLTLSQTDFLKSMKGRSVTQKNIDEVVKQMRERYGSQTGQDGKPNSSYNPAKLQELNELLSMDSPAKKDRFLNSLVGKSGFKADNERIKNFRGGNTMEKLSEFAVALFVQSYPKEYAPDINPFAHIHYPLEARDKMRDAMRDALMHTEQLDEFEAKYSEEWAYTFSFHSGISARNDMMGIGHDAWSKMLNTEYYRLRQTSGGNYPGNLDNLYGIHRLGADMFQGLKVQVDGSNKYDKTFYEIITGLDSKTQTFRINDDMPSYEFSGNAMRQFYADHLMHVIDLFIDVTQKHEFNFDKVIKEDAMGRISISHTEMQKLIDSTWKHMRYGFDNGGFLYDNTMYGWWYDERMDKEGAISRKPHFGFKSLRDLMFSEEVQSMRMYERKDVSGWNGTDKTGDTYAGKMGRNVFAYLIKAQIREHTNRADTATLYDADQVSMIASALVNYAARVMQGEPGEAVVLSGFFTPEEMTRILVFAHAILWQLYLKEYSTDALGGLMSGIFQALSIMMKEIGAGITLKA